MADPALHNAPKLTVNVDLDERSFVFPDGKHISQLRIMAFPSRLIFECSFSFNQSKSNPFLFELDVEDAVDFSRKLVDCVYRAQTTNVISESAHIAIMVTPNGYVWQIGDMNHAREIYFGTGCIWRVCKGTLQALDQVRPAQSN